MKESHHFKDLRKSVLYSQADWLGYMTADEPLKIQRWRFEMEKVDTEIQRTYTVAEIIAILCVSKSTAYKLIQSGEFCCLRIGGQYRIPKRSFDHWLEGMDGGEE